MSHLISEQFTINYNPTTLKPLDLDDYKTVVINNCALRYNATVQPQSYRCHLSYGLDHAMGFWFDMYCDDAPGWYEEPIASSQTMFPLGHNASKRQMLEALCLVLREVDAGYTVAQRRKIEDTGDWVDGMQDTIIDPRAVKLILKDLDPERYHMYEQSGDYRNEAMYFQDTFKDLQDEIASMVIRQRRVAAEIQDARKGVHD